MICPYFLMLSLNDMYVYNDMLMSEIIYTFLFKKCNVTDIENTLSKKSTKHCTT